MCRILHHDFAFRAIYNVAFGPSDQFHVLRTPLFKLVHQALPIGPHPGSIASTRIQLGTHRTHRCRYQRTDLLLNIMAYDAIAATKLEHRS